jgi:hypothetical protein
MPEPTAPDIQLPEQVRIYQEKLRQNLQISLAEKTVATRRKNSGKQGKNWNNWPELGVS